MRFANIKGGSSLSEADIINATRSPVTIDLMYKDLSDLGVNGGDVLLVHSSLSSIGWVCGGAQSVVTALLKATGTSGDAQEGGTLVMPAHSGDWSDPAEWENPPVPKEWMQTIYDNMPPFIPEITPTRGMGRIAELFRIIPGVNRSNHPQVSFCAKGRLAEHITSGHVLSPQFGMESPLGRLYGIKAKVLLLGVGYGSCTSFHLAETLLNEMPVMRTGTAMLENGERVWKWFDDFAYNSDDFELIGKALEVDDTVKKGKVGNSECRLFEMKDGVNFAMSWLRQNRFGCGCTD